MVFKTGTLKKKGRNFKTWRTRFFVFDSESKTLAYFVKATDAGTISGASIASGAYADRARGTITVEGVAHVPDRGGKYLPRRFDVVAADGRIVCCAAETDGDKDAWVALISETTRLVPVAEHPRAGSFAGALL